MLVHTWGEFVDIFCGLAYSRYLHVCGVQWSSYFSISAFKITRNGSWSYLYVFLILQVFGVSTYCIPLGTASAGRVYQHLSVVLAAWKVCSRNTVDCMMPKTAAEEVRHL